MMVNIYAYSVYIALYIPKYAILLWKLIKLYCFEMR